MLVFYILKNDHSLASLYSFLANWLFFSIAAPTPTAPYWANVLPNTAGYFEPVLANYFFSPVTVGLVAVLGAMIVVSVLPRYRSDRPVDPSGIVLPLAAYALVRGVFFFIFNPPEPLLFSPAVMLAHFLMLGVAYAASTFPAKRMLLGLFAALLFATNGSFIVGRTGGGYPPPSAEPSPLIQYPPK